LKLIVSGSRFANIDDGPIIWRELDLIHEQEPIELLIQGGAPGVDAIADEWALDVGVESVTVMTDWAKHGKAAGMMRNVEMLKRYPEALVLAFPKGRSPGTRGCIREAQKMGREPRIVELR
jgi:hypothetical protein